MKQNDWKWWYFVLAGILIAAYGGYEIWSGQIGKAVGSEILGVLCVAIGLFSWKSEARKAAEQSKDKF
jgi:uncharacterized membrane protein YfcA